MQSNFWFASSLVVLLIFSIRLLGVSLISISVIVSSSLLIVISYFGCCYLLLLILFLLCLACLYYVFGSSCFVVVVVEISCLFSFLFEDYSLACFLYYH